MCAKNLSSRPPISLKAELLTIMHAPDTQRIALSWSYCPPSFSTVPSIRPRQNGNPNLSISPPAAPAYSNISRSDIECSFGAQAPVRGYFSIVSNIGPSQPSENSISLFARTKYSASTMPKALL